MKFELHEEQSMQVLSLSGDVDLESSPKAREVILQCLNGGKPLAVELSGVSYMDSSGVASLVEGYQLANSLSLRFALISVSNPALQVLQLARLDRVFPIYPDMSQCLAEAS